MTLQEIFDKVVQHARTQGTEAMDRLGTCVYRTLDGRKCFIGALIPDEEYNPDMEGASVADLCSAYPYIDRMFSGISDYTLMALQDIHDTLPVKKWEAAFEEFAEKHNLTYA